MTHLRYAGPALVAYAAVRALGLLVLDVWARAAGHDAHHILVGWDGQWYKGIAQNGYGFTRIHPDGRHLSDFAFFPLFPWLERWVSGATGLGAADAGLLISAIASLLAAWGMFLVADRIYGRRAGMAVTVVWAALPIGIVQSMAYTESLFTALAAWSLYAVLTGRWVSAGVLAALAGLTRPVGVAIIAAVMIPAAVSLLRTWRQCTSRGAARRQSPAWRVLVGACVAPLGWLGYVGWVGARTGSVLGYFDVTDAWGNGFDGGAAFFGWVWELLAGPRLGAGLLLCIGLALLACLVSWSIRQRQPLSLIVYSVVLVFLAFTTSGYFGSKPRYLLPAFPLLLPIAVVLGRMRLERVAAILVPLGVGSACYGAFWLNGAGPP
ncbi:MAG: hypothetical protein ACRDQA_23310 [Nocardioidaceae bacterium]